VAENAGATVAGAEVGRVIGVFVDCAGGRVGVLNCVAPASCACTVKAACVKTALGSSVGCALEGRLQDESINASTRLNDDMARTDLDMVFLLNLINQFYMIEDVLPSLFVPVLDQKTVTRNA
jgi:hypothetical protein